MRQVARSRSERTLDMEVSTSATKKSGKVMGCSGSSMRPSVVRKKKRDGAYSTSNGSASTSGSAAYSSMGWAAARRGAPCVKRYRNAARLDRTATPSQEAIWRGICGGVSLDRARKPNDSLRSSLVSYDDKLGSRASNNLVTKNQSVELDARHLLHDARALGSPGCARSHLPDVVLGEVVGGVDVEDLGVADARVRKRPQVHPPQRHHVRLRPHHRPA